MVLQEAVRARPNYADAFTGMGISLKELKRREEAEACFQQVVRLRPGCSLSLGNLAGERSYPLKAEMCSCAEEVCVISVTLLSREQVVRQVVVSW